MRVNLEAGEFLAVCAELFGLIVSLNTALVVAAMPALGLTGVNRSTLCSASTRAGTYRHRKQLKR